MLRGIAFGLLLAGCSCSKGPSVPYLRYHVDGKATAPCVSWSPRKLTYEIDPAASSARGTAVTAAVASWRAVSDGCSDFQFADGQGASQNNLIIWRDKTCAAAAPANDPCFSDGTCDDKYACWDDTADSLAVTSLTYSRSTGNILGMKVQLNAAGWLFTTVDSPPCQDGAVMADCVGTDVQNTVTHELGHVLGLDHVDDKSSTMSPYSPVGDLAKRAIDDGTRDGFCAIYPRGMPTPSCLTP